MSTTETWTIGKLLTWTTEYLKKSGSQSPRLDTEVLLAHARSCQRIELYTAFAEEPDEEVKAAFREMVRRRAEGTPVAYLVGHKEFYSATFEVNTDVLIPRPETEHLVVEALDRAKQMVEQRGAATTLRIADVGTGSGVVAITLAKQFADCRVTAVDISQAALEVARRNAAQHELGEDRIEFILGDLLSACEPQQQFDLILSNPPYVSESEYDHLPRTVRDFEPKQALVAGPDGSELIAKLIDQSFRCLAAAGYLIFELSPRLAESLVALTSGQWAGPWVTKDLAGLARVATLQKIG